MRRISTVLAGTAASVALLAAPAMAYTLDSSTGTGFVGKGEVQTAFNLNNKAMQAAHTAVTFTYEGAQTYEFDCEWFTGPERNRTRHYTTQTVARTVDATVTADSRKTGQWTGWTFTLGEIADDASQPTDADCGAEGNQMKTIVEGSVEAVGGESPTLYATHGGITKPLTLTPAV